MFVYKAGTLVSWRQLAIGPGRWVTPTVDKAGVGLIEDWVFNNWRPEYAMWGLTKEIMTLMLMRWVAVARITWAFTTWNAFQGAVVNMKHFISVGASSVAVPLLSLWAGILMIEPVIMLIDLFSKRPGRNEMPAWAAVLRFKGRLWWASVFRHPTNDRWLLMQGPEVQARAFTIKRLGWQPPFIFDEFLFHELWLELGKGTVYHYAYGRIRWDITFVGMGTKAAEGWYWLSLDPLLGQGWDLPVGWSPEASDSIRYATTLHDDFQVAPLL